MSLKSASGVEGKDGGSLLQLEAIVRESHDAIVGKTLEGIITSWNGGAEKMFGYSAEEVIGKPMANLFPSELKDELPRLLDKVRLGEVVADYDSVWFRKDGTRADVEFSISPVHSEDKKIIGASLVGRDISIRKKGEEVLRQIQLIVQNSYDAIIGETLEGIITSWNGGAEKMFGYSAKEVIGKSVLFLFSPEKKDEVMALMNKVKGGEVIFDYDIISLRKDGSNIDIALSISPIKNEEGTIIGASVIKRDITERKKGEEILRQIQLIVENSYDAIIGIIGKDPEGVIASWNGGATKMLGYFSEEVIGKTISFLSPPDIQDKIPVLMEKVRLGETVMDYDLVWLRKDGSNIDIALSISPIKNEEGTIIGASAVGRDISGRKKEEEILRQIQLIVENSHDAIIGIIGETLDGIITSWNGGAEKMFGYSAKEVIGKSILFLLPPDTKDEMPELLKRVKMGEIIADHDSVWLRKDGSKIDIALSISPIKDDKGIVVGASVIERDITERKKGEEVLRQIQLIVEDSYDAIIGETLEGIITSWNGGAEKMFGYSAEEVIGKSVVFLLPPEMENEIKTLLEDIKMGKAIADYDSIRIRKDGSMINISLSISPIKNKEGKIVGASVVERDITERKKGESVILEGIKKFRTYTEKAPLGIFICDETGHYIDVNTMACKLSGYTKEELLELSIQDFLAPEYLDEGLKTFNYLKTSGYSQSEMMVKKKNGDKFWANLVSAMIDEKNFIGFCEDISSRKEAERHIEDLNEIRNKFITIISHQLRTPLTIVNWNLESVLDGDYGKLEDITHKFLQATHKSSIEITNRINDLLTAIDIEEGRVIFKKDDVSLDSITAAIMNEAMRRCKLKGISCEYIAPDKDLPSVECDGEKMRTVISKLVDNAIIYTKENGKIVAKLENIGNVIRFEIKDNGVGIPTPEQHLLFSRFFRASNASVMQPDSFGLGLFLARSFIEQHGGKIGFTSEEDKGSTFWFEIPIINR